MFKKMMRKLSGLKNRAFWSWGPSWPRPDRLQVKSPSLMLLSQMLQQDFEMIHRALLFTLKICFVFFLLISISLELGGLLKFVRPFLISISKAKAARLVRSLLDLFLDMEAATGQEVELCLECIEWAKAEKRTFLRQALEVRKQMPPTQHQAIPLKKYFYDELCWAEK